MKRGPALGQGLGPCRALVNEDGTTYASLENAMQSLREVTSESEFFAEPRESRPAFGRTVRVLLAVIGIVLVTFLIVWNSGAEERAIRALPEVERHALYLRTLDNLKTVCSDAADSMRDFCEGQARMARAFPECDEACYSLAQRQLSRVQLPR